MTAEATLESTRPLTRESIVISRLDDPQVWDRYVQEHPHGSPFHLSAWQRVVQKTFGHEPHHVIARSADGAIVGVLPLFLVRSLIFGRMLVSTPHAAYGGPIASSDAAKEALFQHACTLSKGFNVEFLELRNFRNEWVDHALIRKDLYVTFRQDLYEDPEKNL